MSPLKRSNNIAARMGRWSANHWKTAVFGWLAFVVASVVIGGAVGTKYLEDNDLAVGEAATATKMIEAGFPQADDEQGEIVLIQSKTHTADDPAFKAVIEDVAKTVGGFPEGSQDRHPARRRSRRPRLRRPPLGDGPVRAGRHVRRGRALHRQAQRRCRQDRSRASGLRGQPARQRHHHEGDRRRVRRHAEDGRDDRDPAGAADPAVRVRLRRRGSGAAAARDHRSLRDHEPDRDPEPVHRGRRADRRSDPPDRPRRRNRLLALLPPPRARGAGRRTQRARGPRGRRRHLRPRRPDLGRHRPDCDGRHVPLRRQDVHVLLDRHDDGRRRRHARLAHRPARAARQARRQGREGSDPVPGPAPQQERREPLLGRDPRSCPPPPGRLGRRRRRRADRAGHPGVLPEHGHDGRRRHLDPRDRAVEEVRRRLPGRQRPGRDRDPGRRRPHPGGPGCDRRAEAGSARIRPDEGPDRARSQP